MKMVVGFLFDSNANVLLQLQNPSKKYTGGKLNGIGGKVEIGETPNGAMRREALEEANFTLPGEKRWQQFHYERHPSGNELYFYTAKIDTALTSEMFRPEIAEKDGMLDCSQTEPLFVFDAEAVCFEEQRFPIVPNLMYLLPMALHWLAYPTERYLEG